MPVPLSAIRTHEELPSNVMSDDGRLCGDRVVHHVRHGLGKVVAHIAQRLNQSARRRDALDAGHIYGLSKGFVSGESIQGDSLPAPAGIAISEPAVRELQPTERSPPRGKDTALSLA